MKFYFNKITPIVLFVSLFTLLYSARTVFAVWDGQFYDPGETFNPECSQSSANCDVLVPFSSQVDLFNYFFGKEAGNTTMTGVRNTASGYQSFRSNTTGSRNTVNGYQSLYNNTTGSDNTVLGYNSGLGITTGSNNTILGANVTGLPTNLSNTIIVADGTGAKFIHNFALTGTDGNNTFIGINSGNFTMTGSTGAQGSYNTTIGAGTLLANTLGSYNVANGYRALYSNTEGVANTGIGYQALYLNTTGSNNTALGYQALLNSVSTSSNTAIGYQTLTANLLGTGNTAVGTQTLLSNTDGTGNTGVGYQVLMNNLTANNNTGFGSQALYSNISGTGNVAVGTQPLYFTTTGSSNTAVGYQANHLNISGIDNAAFGYTALYSNKDGDKNTASGMRALYDLGTTQTAGAFNIGTSYTIASVGSTDFTLIGAAANTVGEVFTATGVGAGDGTATPNNINNNTAIGYDSGGGIITGVSNTIIGANVVGLAANLSNNIIIADGDGNRRINVDDTGDVGLGTTTPAAKLDIVDGSGNPQLKLNYSNSGTCTYSTFTVDVNGNLAINAKHQAGPGCGGLLSSKDVVLNSGGGKVGVGGSPANIFHVTGTPTTGTHTARVENTLGGISQNNGLLVLAGNDTGVAASELITFQRPDTTVIGSISQNAAATVAYNLSSDRRIKDNITPTAYGLSDLLKIDVEDFTFISDPNKQKMTGFIAQDLNQIFPGAVTTNGDNGTDPLVLGKTPWMVDYSKVTPLIVKSIQDMNLNLEAISGTITPLENSASESFMIAFFKNVKTVIGTWLADAGNGVAKIFTGEVDTKSLCVSDDSGAKTCITKSQLDALLINSSTSPASIPTPAPTPDPVPTPDPITEPTLEVTPESIPAPAPEVTPVPEPTPEIIILPEPVVDPAPAL